MKLKIRLYIEDDTNQSFMGIGVLWLLKGIQKNGSIRKASQDMKMSYTKAITILNNLEKSLNRTILERQKGGNNRKRTSLTAYGEIFLTRYELFNKRVEDFCLSEFDDFLISMEKDTI